MKYGFREQKLTILWKLKHHQLNPPFNYYQTKKWLENVSEFIFFINLLVSVLMIWNFYGQITAKEIQAILSWKISKPPDSLHLFPYWFKRAER